MRAESSTKPKEKKHGNGENNGRVEASNNSDSRQRAAVRIVTVTAKNEGQRVDNFLLSQLKGVPKSKIYRIIRKGEVRINKGRCKPETKLAVDDLVRIPPIVARNSPKDGFKVSDNLLEFIASAIIYEDKDLLVINKPSGLAVHGGSGVNYGLIEALRKRYPETQFLELVHRLDRDTSGCILVAKSRSALKNLHAQFRNDEVNKIYHMAVFGKWPKHKKRVDAPLRKNELKSGERVVVVHQEGKPSQTLFRILSVSEGFSLVEAKPVTGRTHQIRVHAAFSGHAIVGDNKYIPRDKVQFKGMEKARLMLHAKEIHFTLPGGKAMSFEAPYDEVYQGNLKKMGLLD
jgi:23S rRNA pseudouridine955/2504/2580 synthase